MRAASGYGLGGRAYGSKGAALSCPHNEFVTGHTNNAIAKRSESFDIDLSRAPPLDPASTKVVNHYITAISQSAQRYRSAEVHAS